MDTGDKDKSLWRSKVPLKPMVTSIKKTGNYGKKAGS